MKSKQWRAKRQHVRNHKRAATRQAARHQRQAGRKTKPAAQRNSGGVSYQFMRAVGQLFMAQHLLDPKGISSAANFIRDKKP